MLLLRFLRINGKGQIAHHEQQTHALREEGMGEAQGGVRVKTHRSVSAASLSKIPAVKFAIQFRPRSLNTRRNRRRGAPRAVRVSITERDKGRKSGAQITAHSLDKYVSLSKTPAGRVDIWLPFRYLQIR